MVKLARATCPSHYRNLEWLQVECANSVSGVWCTNHFRPPHNVRYSVSYYYVISEAQRVTNLPSVIAQRGPSWEMKLLPLNHNSKALRECATTPLTNSYQRQITACTSDVCRMLLRQTDRVGRRRARLHKLVLHCSLDDDSSAPHTQRQNCATNQNCLRQPRL